MKPKCVNGDPTMDTKELAATITQAFDAIKAERTIKEKAVQDAIDLLAQRKKELQEFNDAIKEQLGGATKTQKPFDEIEERRASILALAREGITTPSAIMERSGLPMYTVNADIKVLRQRGVWPKVSQIPAKVASKEPAAERTPPAAAGAPAPFEVTPNAHNEGDCMADITTEILRQQGGNTLIQAKFKTTTNRGHVHGVLLDKSGNGMTVSDKSGHVHRVVGQVIQVAHNHRHDIVIM